MKDAMNSKERNRKKKAECGVFSTLTVEKLSRVRVALSRYVVESPHRSLLISFIHAVQPLYVIAGPDCLGYSLQCYD